MCNIIAWNCIKKSNTLQISEYVQEYRLALKIWENVTMQYKKITNYLNTMKTNFTIKTDVILGPHCLSVCNRGNTNLSLQSNGWYSFVWWFGFIRHFSQTYQLLGQIRILFAFLYMDSVLGWLHLKTIDLPVHSWYLATLPNGSPSKLMKVFGHNRKIFIFMLILLGLGFQESISFWI